MKRVLVVILALGLVSSVAGSAAQEGNRTAGVDLVSTWTLTSLEQGLSGGPPTRVVRLASNMPVPESQLNNRNNKVTETQRGAA